MYKKITHTIVEEHFDSPEAVDIKEQWKAPLRYYADGEQIASGLPISYRAGTEDRRCGNCMAFDTSTSTCFYWLQPVRADYVCDAWKEI